VIWPSTGYGSQRRRACAKPLRWRTNLAWDKDALQIGHTRTDNPPCT
jgi:hypothetical protein